MENGTERKEMLLSFIGSEDYQPMKLKEIANFLDVPKYEREELKLLLDELISEGKVILDLKARYKKAGADLIACVFSGSTRGFGFGVPEDGSEDFFIAPDDTMGAHDKDRVLVCIKGTSGGHRKEARVVSILERNDDPIVGTYERTKGYGFVICDNQKFGSDIFIPKGNSKGAVSGSKVVVEITDYGNPPAKNPEGKVIEVIGHIDDPGSDILSVVRAFNIPVEFPAEVMEQADATPEMVLPEEIEGRRDFRNEQTVTIDGEEAKDLDDAVSVVRTSEGYRLSVHIMDVSHYVREGTPLDREALKRGTSNYLVDRVIPMLPHRLSNGICSLNEGVDRLTLSCVMDIDMKGNIVDHEICESVIHVDHRMSYTSVYKIIEEHDPEESEKYKDFVPMFMLMKELAEILRAKRKKRGSIDFDIPESQIIVNEKCEPLEIRPYPRNCAHKLIEDFMLAANETVAEDYFWQELPFEYRTHETPDPEKMQKLAVFINNFGYSIKLTQDEIHPKELQKLMEKIEDTPEEAIISRLTLRSMKQARYLPTCDGHFGLAAKYYCHFTSPIRRYPDLQIHRIIKENLNGKLSDKRINHYNSILPDVCFKNSRAERRADEAEREVEKLKKVEYMTKFLGECFDGVVSGVTSWGLYVELENTCEGVIRIADMTDDYYFFEEENYRLVGEHTKKCYNLGDKLKVQVAACDKMTKTVEFVIPDDLEEDEDLSDKELIAKYSAKKSE